jgi:hypothetical protein
MMVDLIAPMNTHSLISRISSYTTRRVSSFQFPVLRKLQTSTPIAGRVSSAFQDGEIECSGSSQGQTTQAEEA